MTDKAAVAGLRLGGGKAVVNSDPAAVLRSLGGRYITAEDVGTTVDQPASWARAPVVLSFLPDLEDHLASARHVVDAQDVARMRQEGVTTAVVMRKRPGDEGIQGQNQPCQGDSQGDDP